MKIENESNLYDARHRTTTDLGQHTTYDFKTFLKSLPLNFSEIRHTFGTLLYLNCLTAIVVLFLIAS